MPDKRSNNVLSCDFCAISWNIKPILKVVVQIGYDSFSPTWAIFYVVINTTWELQVRKHFQNCIISTTEGSIILKVGMVITYKMQVLSKNISKENSNFKRINWGKLSKNVLS